MKVTIELSETMADDLELLRKHIEENQGRAFSLQDLIIDLVDDVIDVWADDHSNTGLCASCTIAKEYI